MSEHGRPMGAEGGDPSAPGLRPSAQDDATVCHPERNSAADISCHPERSREAAESKDLATATDPTHPRTMRLQRFLARAGVASRRGSEDLMTAGRVSVNGTVVSELGSKVDPDVDRVTVDGMPVRLSDGAVHLMLNKPAGFLTTMRDPQGRPCVASLVPCDRYPGLFPVGRLDKDTTGLLLFTTDGDLAQNLLHPSKHVWKTYQAWVDGYVTDRDLEPLRAGIEIDDGPCLPARCRIMDRDRDRQGPVTRVEVIIREGRKNQVKRMLARIHHPVLELHRASFGALSLGTLPEGTWRELTAKEVAQLKESKGLLA